MRILHCCLIFIAFSLSTFGQQTNPKENTYNFHPLDTSQLLTLRVNVILLRKSDGTGSFDTTNQKHMQYFEDVFNYCNLEYSFKDRVLDSACNSKSTFSDSRIRFRLNKIIYFDDDFYWNNANDKNRYKCPDRTNWYLLPVQAQLDSVLPLEEQGINVYISADTCLYNFYAQISDTCDQNISGVACSMYPSKDTADFSVISYPDALSKYLSMAPYPYEWAWSTFGKGLAHELGHSLGLYHLRTCENIMNPSGKGARRNLEDHQLAIARNKILSTNLKRYLD